MSLEEISAAQEAGFPILSALIALPLLAVVALGLTRTARWAYRVGVAAALAELALAVLLVARFQRGAPDVQFVERIPIGSAFDYHVGVDGISVLFVPLTALLTLLVVLYAEQASKADPRRYLMAIFGLVSTLLGAITSLDLALFWIFAALELVPGFLLIRFWGTGPARETAARRYLIFNIAGALLLLGGIAVLAHSAGAAPASIDGSASPFDFLRLLRAPIPPKDQSLAFALLFLGLAVRVPLFPFHGWLAVVMEEGPVVGVGVFLVGVKLGAYAILRFAITLLPDAAREWGSIAIAVSVIGMVYGALLALVQTNLRRMLAFACLSHMGSVMVGLFSLNKAGFEGGLLAMLNAGIAAAGLFFIAGFIHLRLGSSELAHASGLSQRAPLLSLTFLVIALAIIGMPGTSGFDAEHLVVEGAVDAHHVPTAVAAGASSLLGAAYLFRYYQRAFLAPAREPLPAGVRDLRAREILIAACFGAMILGVGLSSHALIVAVDGSVRVVSERVEQGAPEGSDEHAVVVHEPSNAAPGGDRDVD